MWGRGSLHRGDDNRSSQDEISHLLLVTHVFTQDVFVIPDGAPGALAELERRKFTAEEGVSTLKNLYPIFLGLTCFSGSSHSAEWYSHHLPDATDAKLIYPNQPTMLLPNTENRHLGVGLMHFPSAQCLGQCPFVHS